MSEYSDKESIERLFKEALDLKCEILAEKDVIQGLIVKCYEAIDNDLIPIAAMQESPTLVKEGLIHKDDNVRITALFVLMISPSYEEDYLLSVLPRLALFDSCQSVQLLAVSLMGELSTKGKIDDRAKATNVLASLVRDVTLSERVRVTAYIMLLEGSAYKERSTNSSTPTSIDEMILLFESRLRACDTMTIKDVDWELVGRFVK
jgi:hypothetical protein